LPKQGLENVLDTYATESQLSVCLQQRDEHGVLHPIGYWSRQLSPTERRYHITEKEAFAVHWAVKQFRSRLSAPAPPSPEESLRRVCDRTIVISWC
jgi:hypothetical protein